MALRTLYQTLLDSDLARLRVIAQQWEITLTAGRRADIAAELADTMARIEAVEKIWAALSETQKAALADVLRHAGALPWAIFTRRWGQIRTVGPGRLEREQLWRDPISTAEGLWYWGLIQRVYSNQHNTEMAFIPGELRLYLPEAPPLETPKPRSTEPPTHQKAGDDSFADDIVSLWAALQHTPNSSATLLNTSALHAQINLPVRERVTLLKTLALEQGWVREDNSGLLHPAPEPVLEWLKTDVWQQWSSLAQAWINSQRWNDLAAVPNLQMDSGAAWPNNPLRTRTAFLACLKQCAAGVWYTNDDFVAHVREHTTDFLRPDGDYESWPLRDTQSGVAYRGFDSWPAVEGALVRHFINGPLTWLGLVDLGRSSAEHSPTTFLINAAGAAFLHSAAPPEQEEVPRVHLSDAGILFIPARRRYERFQLSRVASFVNREQGYYYRLTPSSLSRASQQRIKADRLIGFLEEAIGQPLAPHIHKAIKQIYQQGEQARLSQVWLLRVQDPQLLKIPQLQRYIVEQITPNVAVIRAEDKEHVLSNLLKVGHLSEFIDPQAA